MRRRELLFLQICATKCLAAELTETGATGLSNDDLPVYEQEFLIRTRDMWQNFLKGYVEPICFRACWERWLPMDIDHNVPGYYQNYPNVYVDPDYVVRQPSSELCKRQRTQEPSSDATSLIVEA